MAADPYEVRAQIDLSTLYDRLYKETLRSIADHEAAGRTGQALAAAVVADLDALSDTAVEQAARGAATQAFNAGRDEALRQNAARISEVVRTEILDANTCDPCRDLDGTTYEV